MEWYNQQVSFYSSHSDNTGQAMSIRDVLLTEGPRAINVISELRKLDPCSTDYDVRSKAFKSKLPCFTPAALLYTKAKGQLKEISRTGLMQLDFDYKDIKDFDLDEITQAVFDLPFIAFVSRSCSGNGFYALAVISEPEKLKEYAEHCFQVLEYYGIKADTSKGKKPENLRYVSYDSKMMIRENPEPLQVKAFKKKAAPVKSIKQAFKTHSNNGLVRHCLRLISNCVAGERWDTVQKAAYTLGGLNDDNILSQIKDSIKHNSQFAGVEEKYIQCATVCFNDGKRKPLIKTA